MLVNALMERNGITMKYPQREIVTGNHIDFKKNFKAVFGSYNEANNYPTITNNINPSTHECNLQGTQKVFCLSNGRVLNIRNTIPMVAPYQVIKTLNDWYKKLKRQYYGRSTESPN